MSRFRRFAHSLVSGYVLLGANTLYTLASIPLALAYLSKAEFALWTLTTAIGSYISLVDFGMGASVARILVDHKDDRASGGYGSVVQTGVLVGLTQGFLILLAGTGLAVLAGPLLRVPEELQRDFTWLMIGQCALLGLSFAGRIFLYMLTAHQRYDISNYGNTALFASNYAVMWLLFARGWGVFSILWAQAIGTGISVGINAWGCVRLELLPRRGEWGRPTRPLFNELFIFGRDIFLFALGGQLINTSQALLLTRFYGLEAAAVWSICTRIFSKLLEVVYRVFDYSSAALAEMIVRGEKLLLADRFKHIVTLSTSLSVGAATLFALCNDDFVEVWTSGKLKNPALTQNELKDAPALVNRLQRQADPVSAFVWRQLPEPLRLELGALTTGAEISAQLRSNLVIELNRVVGLPSFYDPQRFADVQLRPEARTMLDRPVGGPEVALLNRRLLDSAYPLELYPHDLTRWRPLYDLLLAAWLVVCVSLHVHTGLVGQTKRMLFLKYIFFLEGLAFVGLTVLFRRQENIGFMLGASLVCSLAFSFPYGLRRTRAYFGLTWGELAGWHRGPLQLALWLTPAAVTIWFLTRNLPPVWRLMLNATTVGMLAIWLFLRHGLGEYLQGRLLQSSPKWLRTLFVRIGVPSPKAEAK